MHACRSTLEDPTELEASNGRNVAATPSLREAIVRWAPGTGAFALTAGQFKTPFSKEYLVLIPSLETADFSAVIDSLAPKYDVGVMAEYSFGPLASVYVGGFNGEGQNAIANRDSSVLLVARGTVRPVAPLSLGVNFARDSDDSLRWGVEAIVEQSGGMLRAEYVTRHKRGRPGEHDDFGWYVLGTFRVTPRIQLVGRQDEFRRPEFNRGRNVRATTVGTNLELVPNKVKLLLNGVRRRSGAAQTTVNSLIGQLQVRF